MNFSALAFKFQKLIPYGIVLIFNILNKIKLKMLNL